MYVLLGFNELNLQGGCAWCQLFSHHIIMNVMASQIISLTIVYSSMYSGADQRIHQSSTSLAFVRGIHRWPVNSPHKGPVSLKMFPFDDVIMWLEHSINFDIRLQTTSIAWECQWIISFHFRELSWDAINVHHEHSGKIQRVMTNKIQIIDVNHHANLVV